VAVAVDPPELLLTTKRKLHLDHVFLSDEQGALMDAFELRQVGGNPENGGDIPRPATILLDSKGNIIWASITDNYRVRPKPEKVLAAVRSALGG